jgi:hypothetical protein
MYHRDSPLHIPNEKHGGGRFIDPIQSLFKALEARDPPTDRQAAATPELLKEVDKMLRPLGVIGHHTADLIVGAYFFAMRGCEFCYTERRGRTKLLTLGNVTFRGRSKRVIPQEDPQLLEKASYVTVCFVNQKNGRRMEKRTQGRSGEKRFCPVRAWGRACQRVRRSIAGASNETPVCSVAGPSKGGHQVTDKQVASALKTACDTRGGKDRFGFGPENLGTRSIRSGAAMALFLMDHSVEKIKILGRWQSDAFLAYIRPQVLEWTSTMSNDMVKIQNFKDLSFGSGEGRHERSNWEEMGRTKQARLAHHTSR